MKNLLLFLFLMAVACSEETSEPKIYLSVSGVIYENGKASLGSQVSIDNKMNLTTVTNERGQFTILNVPDGKHDLRIVKYYSDGSYSEINKPIHLSRDTFLNQLILPEQWNWRSLNSQRVG